MLALLRVKTNHHIAFLYPRVNILTKQTAYHLLLLMPASFSTKAL